LLVGRPACIIERLGNRGEVVLVPRIEELIAEHEGEWLAIEVTKEENGHPKEGILVYHSPVREEVWEKTRERKRLYIVYAGPPLKEGYAAAFIQWS